MVDPMYRQIADDLRRQIEAGELAPGAQLRTELELREKYDASRNTVRDAVKWLITRGLVETRPGQGTYVVEKISPFVTTLTGDDDGSGGEGATYVEKAVPDGEADPDYDSEVKAMRRKPEAARPGWRYSRPTPIPRELAGSRAPWWSAGISGDSSTRHPGRCRRPSIR